MNQQPKTQPLSRPDVRSSWLIDDTALVLSAADFNSFVAALESSSAPGPKLRALMRRVPGWAARNHAADGSDLQIL
ncbi:DUF1778 domain-containing protein [Sphingomonas sp. SUN039]|uniref:type II toxin -antitoxin system TacA 1-like antitoxin n=1 Tax=Sphingomonas sp. SUN039 TaxID=2937787 RepID=UPI0038D4A71C